MVTPPEAYASVRSKLEEYGLTVDSDHSGLQFLPTAYIEVSE